MMLLVTYCSTGDASLRVIFGQQLGLEAQQRRSVRYLLLMGLLPQEEQKKRAYGGKVGVWLKKKRRHSNDTGQRGVLPPESPSPAKHCEGQNADVATSPSSSLETEDASLSSPKVKLVGWDDVLCRPIYRGVSSAGSPSSTCKHDDEEDESTAIVNDDIEMPSANEETCVEKEWCFSDGTSKAARSYGTKKRSRAGLSEAAVSILDDFVTSGENNSSYDKDRKKAVEMKKNTVKPSYQHGKKRRRRRNVSNKIDATAYVQSSSTSTASSSRGRKKAKSMTNTPAALEMVSPLPTKYRNYICSSLDSDTKETSNCGGLKIKSLARKKIKMGKKEICTDLTELDFSDETVRQPSSNTSLDAAKAFFEQLDATQELNLSSAQSPILQGKACVRTTWTTNVQCPKLRQEYVAYRKATKSSGVAPLSLMEFAINRRTHLRKSDMFDGFLDV